MWLQGSHLGFCFCAISHEAFEQLILNLAYAGYVAQEWGEYIMRSYVPIAECGFTNDVVMSKVD